MSMELDEIKDIFGITDKAIEESQKEDTDEAYDVILDSSKLTFTDKVGEVKDQISKILSEDVVGIKVAPSEANNVIPSEAVKAKNVPQEPPQKSEVDNFFAQKEATTKEEEPSVTAEIQPEKTILFAQKNSETPKKENDTITQKVETSMASIDELLGQPIGRENKELKRQVAESLLLDIPKAPNLELSILSPEIVPNNKEHDLPDIQESKDVPQTKKTSEKIPENLLNLYDWNLTSNQSSFDRFYREKKNILSRICPYKLDFKTFKQDLKDAKVSVITNIYDLPEIHRKMQEVQSWRDRVREIYLELNTQYYHFKTAIKSLEGLLSMTCSVKPSQGREGLNYEHVGDVQMYFDDLESTYRSAEATSKQLDNTFECLSRQLTIAIPQNSIDRFTERLVQSNAENKMRQEDVITAVTQKKVAPAPVPEELKDFDSLDDALSTVKVTPKKVEPKEVTWDMFGKK